MSASFVDIMVAAVEQAIKYGNLAGDPMAMPKFIGAVYSHLKKLRDAHPLTPFELPKYECRDEKHGDIIFYWDPPAFRCRREIIIRSNWQPEFSAEAIWNNYFGNMTKKRKR